MIKKFISISTKCLLIALFSSNLNAQSQVIILNSNQPQTFSATLVAEKAEGLELNFSLNQFELTAVTTQYGVELIAETDKAPQLMAAGAPDVFYLPQSVIIPNSGSMELKVIPGDYKEYENIDIAPSKGNLYRNVNPNDIPFVKGKHYENNEFFPGKLASLRDPFVLRDFRGQTIDVFPVQYNPVTKTLRVYQNITVVLHHTNQKGTNELLKTKNNNSIEQEFSHLYSSVFLNYNQKKYTPLEEEGELLIICYDQFTEAMKPFVNWKRTIGRKTQIISKTDAGSTSSAIKSYISNYYNNPDNNLAYVLLVGDAAQVPTNTTASGHSDNAYGYLEGNDSYSEIFMGRFSAESIADVETQVQRMIEYERDLTSEDTWLNIGLGVSRNEGEGNGHNGEADYEHIDFIRDTLLNYTYTEVHREYDGGVPGVPNTTAAQISARINDGVSIINYCNHGSETSWSVANYGSSNVNSLTNTGKLPFIWAVACVNGAFVNTKCFAETWLRATYNGEPAGAIGTMMSTINQAWQPPMTGQDEMVTILSESFENNTKRTFGGLSFNGSMKMLDVHGASGKETYDTWTLFGDPTLMVRTDTPLEMIVTHDENLIVGSTSTTVTCDTEGATVTLTKLDIEGNVEIVDSKMVSNGIANLLFSEPISNVETFTLAVTSYNKQTYIDEIESVPADRPFVIVENFSTSASPNFGETVNLNVTLKNVSEEPYTASLTQAQITSESEYVTILSSELDAETINPGQSVSFSNAFQFEIVNNVPDQTPLIFKINLTYQFDSDSYESVQTVVVKANAPVIVLNSYVINDNDEGIPGILDAGETADVIFSITNSGHADAADLTVELSHESEYISISSTNPITVENLPAGETTEASFTTSANEETPLETPVNLNVTAQSGEYKTEKTYEIIVGYIPEYNMGEVQEVVACIGKFFDSGGASETYSSNESKTVTFFPATEGNSLMFKFSEFDVEEGYDYLYIYDGENTDAQEIEGSPFTGTNSPGQIVATNEAGAFTFRFESDGYEETDGWQAQFNCVDISVIPNCSSNPFPAQNGLAEYSPIKLSWDFVEGAQQYDIYIGVNELPEEATETVTANSYKLDLEPFSTYRWKVVPRNFAGEVEGCPTWEFQTEDIASIIEMKNGNAYACNSFFYDSGGKDSNYTLNENNTLVIFPSTEWAKVKVEFSAFQTEDGYDKLTVYDGNSSNAPLINTYSGSNLPPSITSTHTTGALTFYFESDYMQNDAGWEALITCELVQQPVTFIINNSSGQPINDVKISTPIDTVYTNGEGSASINMPQNCEFTYELSKDGYNIRQGTFTVEDQPKTVTLKLYTVSTPEVNSDNLMVFPNPFSESITLSGNNSSYTGYLVSALGQIVLRFESSNDEKQTIKTTGLPKGVYFLVVNSNTQGISVNRLVKE
ncbi:MAG TPA: C25 family cysteine peptidase [Tenuifilaceae bacterium]|nr:C25 family cysteine peptidase [Tenuifilaceae bacterium]